MRCKEVMRIKKLLSLSQVNPPVRKPAEKETETPGRGLGLCEPVQPWDRLCGHHRPQQPRCAHARPCPETRRKPTRTHEPFLPLNGPR